MYTAKLQFNKISGKFEGAKIFKSDFLFNTFKKRNFKVLFDSEEDIKNLLRNINLKDINDKRFKIYRHNRVYYIGFKQ